MSSIQGSIFYSKPAGGWGGGEASLLQISTKGVKLHFFIGKPVKK